MRWALRRPGVAALGMALVAGGGVGLYSLLESDFLPAQDEGAFVIDYFSRPGTSLTETNRMLMHVEEILRETPEIEGYSRRTGARLALAILAGSVLAMFGVAAALWLTGTTLNIISFLGAIIGIGITAKNGILMLDYVDHLTAGGLALGEALVQSGRRRLRPVLMTSLTTFLGLLPLAYGVGGGADMLRPMAIAVIGSLFMSLLLSLVATPVFYYLMVQVVSPTPHPERFSAATSQDQSPAPPTETKP